MPCSPCYKCQRRYVGCSTTCPDWVVWKAEQAKEAAYTREKCEATWDCYNKALPDNVLPLQKRTKG